MLFIIHCMKTIFLSNHIWHCTSIALLSMFTCVEVLIVLLSTAVCASVNAVLCITKFCLYYKMNCNETAHIFQTIKEGLSPANSIMKWLQKLSRQDILKSRHQDRRGLAYLYHPSKRKTAQLIKHYFIHRHTLVMACIVVNSSLWL